MTWEQWDNLEIMKGLQCHLSEAILLWMGTAALKSRHVAIAAHSQILKYLFFFLLLLLFFLACQETGILSYCCQKWTGCKFVLIKRVHETGWEGIVDFFSRCVPPERGTALFLCLYKTCGWRRKILGFQPDGSRRVWICSLACDSRTSLYYVYISKIVIIFQILFVAVVHRSSVVGLNVLQVPGKSCTWLLEVRNWGCLCVTP